MIQSLTGQGKYNLQAANQLLKISTDLQRLAIGAAAAQVELSGKDNEPIDMIVETFWGRGTDPRRKVKEEDEEEQEEDEEGTEFSIEFDEEEDEEQ